MIAWHEFSLGLGHKVKLSLTNASFHVWMGDMAWGGYRQISAVIKSVVVRSSMSALGTLRSDAGAPSYIVWLGDLNQDAKIKTDGIKHRTRYLVLDSEISKHPPIAQALQTGCGDSSVLPESSHIVGFAALEATAQHHALLELSEEERIQRDLWRLFTQTDIHGKLYYFRVVRVKKLSMPVPLSFAATKYKRRFFGQVSTSWGREMLETALAEMSDHEFGWWQECLQMCCPEGDGIPEVVMRLPKAFLLLILERFWTRVCLPDLHKEGFFLRVGWDAFHNGEIIPRDIVRGQRLSSLFFTDQVLVDDRHMPLPPQFAVASSEGRVALHMLLQKTASAVMGCRPFTDDARNQLLLELLSAAVALEDAEAQSQLFLHRNASRAGTRRYNVSTLLNFFFLSGFLHRDRDLREALEWCIKLVLPQDQATAALKLLHGDGPHKLNVPSASTISRARFKVDVAYMLVFRDRLKAFLQQGGVKIIVQTDATFQAGKQYQITILNMIKTMDLDIIHKDPLQGLASHVVLKQCFKLSDFSVLTTCGEATSQAGSVCKSHVEHVSSSRLLIFVQLVQLTAYV